MSKKENKFEPSMGWIVAINAQQVAVDRLAKELAMDNVEVGKALDRAGYQLEPDPFNFLNDTWKVLDIEKRKAHNVQEEN